MCEKIEHHASEQLVEIADSSCTTGYDNDGSTGIDIFENGFELAEKAAGQDVFEWRDNNTAYFFIGSEEKACQTAREYLKELENG